jgi:hypothetical protein
LLFPMSPIPDTSIVLSALIGVGVKRLLTEPPPVPSSHVTPEGVVINEVVSPELEIPWLEDPPLLPDVPPVGTLVFDPIGVWSFPPVPELPVFWLAFPALPKEPVFGRTSDLSLPKNQNQRIKMSASKSSAPKIMKNIFLFIDSYGMKEFQV